jgi:hypothetical protein
VLLAGLAVPALAQDHAAPPHSPDRAPTAAAPASLPIRTITLYRSGVGYFERRGTIDAGDKTSLHFATDQINDMLKSMVILDPQQALESVSYGSKEPLARRLAAFGINIADEPTLATILGRIRGTKARFVTSDGTISGVVLGVESRAQAQGNAHEPIAVPYVNVVTEQGIRSVNLTTLASVELADKDLNAELMKALGAIAEHQADRVKSVDLTFGGNGARSVVVAYVSEMPIWKTSYRLVLPEQPEDRKDPKEQGGLPTIQGWAIVENTTDEDWENVRLGLVAGRPVSFQMDLYEPLYVARPEIPVPTVPGVMPRVYQDAAAFETGRALEGAANGTMGFRRAEAPRIDLQEALRKSVGGGGSGGQSPFRAADGRDTDAEKPISADDLIRYSAAARAGGGEIGEVFEYTLKTPVSIARQRSAMLPILASAINGRRVSIFNRADGAEHPMRGVELTNSTGLQLIPGPISVFDGAAYAGDAQIGHITTGDKRLLAYAVDLDVQALVKEESQSNVKSIKIVSGLIQQTTKQVSKVKYAFANKDAKRPRQILVEQPKVAGWDLVEPKKPTEETTDLYRFELPLAPGASDSISVVQERTDVQSFAVTQYDFNTLLAYAKDGRASQAVVDAVKHAAELQAAAAETERRIALLTQERQTIDQDQARIRQNMAAVARDTDLYRRYTARLNEQETRLEAIRDQTQKENDTLTQQRRELDAYVRSLNVE